MQYIIRTKLEGEWFEREITSDKLLEVGRCYKASNGVIWKVMRVL